MKEVVLQDLEIVIDVRRFFPCQGLSVAPRRLPCPAHGRAPAGGMDPVRRENPGSSTMSAKRSGSGATACGPRRRM